MNDTELPPIYKKQEKKDEFDPSKIELKKEDPLLINKIKNFLKKDVRPYIQRRNLSDPFEEHNYDGGCKQALEIGIKISF